MPAPAEAQAELELPVISEVQLDGCAGSRVAWASGAVPLLAVEARRLGSESPSVCVLHPGCPEVRDRQWGRQTSRSSRLVAERTAAIRRRWQANWEDPSAGARCPARAWACRGGRSGRRGQGSIHPGADSIGMGDCRLSTNTAHSNSAGACAVHAVQLLSQQCGPALQQMLLGLEFQSLHMGFPCAAQVKRTRESCCRVLSASGRCHGLTLRRISHAVSTAGLALL